jgi:L-amino acid N-acyltransferase YncA
MNIRQAVAEDVEQAIDLLKEFQEESLKEYGTDLDIESIRATCQSYIGTTLVAEVNGKIVGILAGKLLTTPASVFPIYQEEVWYVSKAHRRVGVYLLKTLEEECRKQGISHIILAHMGNSKADKLADFFIRSGYAPFQINYIKKIGGTNESAPASQGI